MYWYVALGRAAVLVRHCQFDRVKARGRVSVATTGRASAVRLAYDACGGGTIAPVPSGGMRVKRARVGKASVDIDGRACLHRAGGRVDRADDRRDVGDVDCRLTYA
jgi:hypothetical protein